MAVQFSSPSSDLFTFPPKNDPRTLLPPSPGSTLSAPLFSIPSWLYNIALDAKVPITIATVYAITVTYTNAYNRSTGQKPWAISKTKAFKRFVIAHNILLAVYSGWTFVAMFKTLQRTVQNPNGSEGLAGTVDSLCKIHGVEGIGNAITYNPATSGWISQSPSSVRLSQAGTPNSTDLGRIWNEGLAFIGWFFYLSKFYEVLDTAIILAKGKRSGTLQTYHHAGAMMCMWAGIRFMSPPIWMFVFVNSGIHTLMYTYYTLTAFSIRIPGFLKQTLTTMQITQFLVGASYAALHSFVSYTIPVQVPNIAASVASTSYVAATPAGFGDIIKKFLFRGVGEEGLAENIGSHSAPHVTAGATQGYRTEYQTVPCVDTSGQTFAIWLNVVYLTPLTVLFVRFFVKTYILSPAGPKRVTAAKAGKDALKGVERRFYENGTVNGKANGKNGHANGAVRM